MEDSIWNCITRRITGAETEESKLRLDNWLNEEADHLQQYNEAVALWSLSGQLKETQPEIPFQALLDQHQVLPGKKQLKFPTLWRYGIAASIVLLLLIALLFKSYNGSIKSQQTQEWVIKKAGIGQIILVNMPDSSKIWLNSGTRIKFLKSFTKEKVRTVFLTGEAYFDVHHDPSHPFVVKSDRLTTTVYGTSFNVRAYGNEQESSVIVNSGKVGVVPLKENLGATMLLPQDKLVYNRGKFTKSITNTRADGWITGDIVFDQTPLPEVFNTISRKFGVKIQANSAHYQHCKLTARFRNQPLSVVLKALKMSMNIQSVQKGKTIYLEGGIACSSHTK